MPHFEVVIVDDGSTDGTAARVEGAASRDPRIRFLRQPAAGIVAALERGRAACRTPFIARFDIDDEMHPERLARQIARMHSDRNPTLVGCQVRYISSGRVTDGARRYAEWLNGLRTHDAIVRDLFVECPIAHPTFLVRAEALDRVGGYRAVEWAEDYDLIFRLWEAGGRFETVDEVLHDWRDRPDRLSRTDPRYRPERFLACKVHYLRRTVLREDRPILVWGAGPTGKRSARALRRSGLEIRGFVDVDPRKIGQTISRVRVLDAEEAAERRECFAVACVSGPGPRARIRKFLGDRGWVEMEDFVAMA